MLRIRSTDLSKLEVRLRSSPTMTATRSPQIVIVSQPLP